MMSTYKNRAQQATHALKVDRADGIVRVRDGVDQWLAHHIDYDHAIERLSKLAPIDDDGEAYTELCDMVSETVASVVGMSRGNWRDLVTRALAADLIDADDARAFS